MKMVNNMEPKQETFTVKRVLANEDELQNHLEKLNEKYGRGNVPLEEALNFDFQWDIISTT